MNVCYFDSVHFAIIIRLISVVLLDKELEVLSLMIQHGILERLCEIFCTCKDEDTLVRILS